ncbi:hypothetical protein ABZV21_31420 [Streptomyces clavifer]
MLDGWCAQEPSLGGLGQHPAQDRRGRAEGGGEGRDEIVEVTRDLTAAVGGDVTGADNRAGTAVADIDLVVMPWAGQAELLTSLIDELCDKAVVDLASARLGSNEPGA